MNVYCALSVTLLSCRQYCYECFVFVIGELAVFRLTVYLHLPLLVVLVQREICCPHAARYLLPAA